MPHPLRLAGHHSGALPPQSGSLYEAYIRRTRARKDAKTTSISNRVATYGTVHFHFRSAGLPPPSPSPPPLLRGAIFAGGDSALRRSGAKYSQRCSSAGAWHQSSGPVSAKIHRPVIGFLITQPLLAVRLRVTEAVGEVVQPQAGEVRSGTTSQCVLQRASSPLRLRCLRVGRTGQGLGTTARRPGLHLTLHPWASCTFGGVTIYIKISDRQEISTPRGGHGPVAVEHAGSWQ